jgi:excisionase family DNA binding protein
VSNDTRIVERRHVSELLRISDAQEILGGISRPMIYRLVEKGHLTRVKLGSRAFITRASIHGYLRHLGVEVTP